MAEGLPGRAAANHSAARTGRPPWISGGFHQPQLAWFEIAAAAHAALHADTAMMHLRVVLADGHALVRAGIRALLERIPGVHVVAEARDGPEALEMARTHNPDFLLLDFSLPGVPAPEVASQVKREFPRVRILLLSMHAEEKYVEEALRAGASGYLLKDGADVELNVALTTVYRGETYVSPAVPRTTVDVPLKLQASRNDEPPGCLTPRQTEVLVLVANGRSTKEIAGDLGLSTKTVEAHRAAIMERLRIHEVTGLVKYAMRNGLIAAEVCE